MWTRQKGQRQEGEAEESFFLPQQLVQLQLSLFFPLYLAARLSSYLT